MATSGLDFSDLTGEGPEDSGGSHDGHTPQSEDICRVCRVGFMPGRPLFHPCVCTGSIRYIHQDCLVQWLKHSGKEICELCLHRFEFVPIYRPDMPKRLPMTELASGLLRGALKNIRHWLHLGFVAFVWLVMVPICIYRIYSFLLYGSLWSITSFPLQLFSLENLLLDDIYGLLIVFVSLLGFISMVWLKDQLGNGGAPNWLARDQQEVAQQREQEVVGGPNEPLDQEQNQERLVRQGEAVSVEQLRASLDEQLQHLKEIEKHEYTDKIELLESRREVLTTRAYRTSASHTPPADTMATSRIADEAAAALPRNRRHHDLAQSGEPADVAPSELSTVTGQLANLQRDHHYYTQHIENFLLAADPGSDDAMVEQMLNSPLLGNEEKAVIGTIWLIKEDLRAAEEGVGGEEHRAWRARWRGRLHRQQQEQVDVNVQRARPNIFPALVGLARDQPADRAVLPAQENVEELTWARLLGLDGSFRFLEHVVWLICLNSALIILFVYLPYQVGYFAAQGLKLWNRLGIKTWKGVGSTVFGYFIGAALISMVYYCTGILRLPKIKSFLGMAYIGIKVGIILALEAGVFPLMCGWWIDICSFALFGSSMKSRQASLSNAPGTMTFIHWLAGMIFIFYLASFVMLMREVVRPGVLWFLRNLNDQNFHPIYEMIGLPLQRHFKRFIMSCIMFGVCLVVVLFVPSRLMLLLLPNFLPYRLSLSSSFSPIREVQLELILLQFVIPTLLEHGNCRAGLKLLLQSWASLSARLFGLESYLLDKPQAGGSIVDVHGNVIPDVPPNPDPEGPVYTDPVQVLGPGFAPFKPYLRPPLFHLRILGFLSLTLGLTVAFSMALLVLPVSIGRVAMSVFGVSEAPEIYTAAVGVYTLWLVIRFGSTTVGYIMQGTEILVEQVKLWSLQGLKCAIAGFLLFVVIPLLLGHLVDLLLISPLRVPHDRTPVFYPSTEWALGLLHTKCTCGAIWLTNVSFKAKLDRVYQDGFRNLNLTFVIREVTWPVIVPLSLAITVPYATFMGLLPALGYVDSRTSLLVYRYFFPAVLLLLLAIALMVFVAKQLKRLYTHIKNERYLVGRQLVNYEGANQEGEAMSHDKTD